MVRGATTTNPQEQTVTAEQIEKAIARYEANVEAIGAMLPVDTPGIRYKTGSLKVLDRFIESWKAKTLALFLAVAYIRRPLAVFYQELAKRAAETEVTKVGSIDGKPQFVTKEAV